jgi:hypothetical protein
MPVANYDSAMKFPVLLLGLALTTGVGLAETSKPTEPVKPVESVKVAEPAKPANVTKPAVKKEEPLGKIEGTAITRPNGLYLGLTVADGKFKLTFYDKKKKPATVDVTRGLARWANVHGPGDNRAVLNPDGAHSLVATQFVRPPYVFKIYLTLTKGDGDAAEAAETYVVDFHG